jgi:hypothetical protein
MMHIAAISQIRLDTDGRAYYRRKQAEGKRPLEALRCLIGGVSKARPDRTRTPALQPLPGPAPTTLAAHPVQAQPHTGSAAQQARPRAGAP